LTLLEVRKALRRESDWYIPAHRNYNPCQTSWRVMDHRIRRRAFPVPNSCAIYQRKWSMNVQKVLFVPRYAWLGAYCPIKN